MLGTLGVEGILVPVEKIGRRHGTFDGIPQMPAGSDLAYGIELPRKTDPHSWLAVSCDMSALGSRKWLGSTTPQSAAHGSPLSVESVHG